MAFWNKKTDDLQLQVNQLTQAVSGSFSAVRDQLAQVLGKTHEGNRDLYREFGYKHNPSFNEYYELATQNGFANRLVFGIPKSCWRDGFIVKQNANEDSEEILTQEVEELNEKGLTRKLESAHILSRIGSFSCLFVGVPDGLDPKEPIGRVSGNAINSVYFKAFAYDGIQIYEQDQDPLSPRYGLPLYYQVQKMSRDNYSKDIVTNSIIVHHSRIVHMVDMPLDSEIEGIPYLKAIYNATVNLIKSGGGSAEALYRNIQRIIVTELPDNMQMPDENARKNIDEATKEFTNKMKNFITSKGKVHDIKPSIADPLNTFMVNLYEILAYSGVPLRVFTGEGGGQYAGQEDQLAYNSLIMDTQNLKCSQYALDTLKILGNAGVIKLTGSEVVEFNVQEASTEERKVEIANKQADTLNKLMDAASKPAGDDIKLNDELMRGFGLDVELDTIDIDKGL